MDNKITKFHDLRIISLFFFSLVLTGFLLSGCAELEENITEPQELSFHKEGINNPHSENFHGELVRDNQWRMDDCQQCHGGNFSGGVSGPSCLTCHSQPAGPAACNTCHGDFSNPGRIAPPKDISNNTSPSERGVGLHTVHLYESTTGSTTRCGSCHNFPQSLYAPGHLDTDLPAEVVLKSRATLFGAVNASYDPAAQTCANTYCHGNFTFYRDSAETTNQFAYTADRMTGINNTVSWTNPDGSEKECGSCHGLPPEGHIDAPLNSCYTCHQGVVDQEGQILDKTRHINGEINARGTGNIR